MPGGRLGLKAEVVHLEARAHIYSDVAQPVGPVVRVSAAFAISLQPGPLRIEMKDVAIGAIVVAPVASWVAPIAPALPPPACREGERQGPRCSDQVGSGRRPDVRVRPARSRVASRRCPGSRDRRRERLFPCPVSRRTRPRNNGERSPR